MRLFDTSAWIETLIGSALGVKLQNELPSPEETVVPTLVQLELEKWLLREQSGEAADRVIAYTMTCVVVPLDTDIALRAAEISSRLKLPVADSIIYATALAQSAELVTCDRHFDGLPAVLHFAKSANP